MSLFFSSYKQTIAFIFWHLCGSIRVEQVIGFSFKHTSKSINVNYVSAVKKKKNFPTTVVYSLRDIRKNPMNAIKWKIIHESLYMRRLRAINVSLKYSSQFFQHLVQKHTFSRSQVYGKTYSFLKFKWHKKVVRHTDVYGTLYHFRIKTRWRF